MLDPFSSAFARASRCVRLVVVGGLSLGAAVTALGAQAVQRPLGEIAEERIRMDGALGRGPLLPLLREGSRIWSGDSTRSLQWIIPTVRWLHHSTLAAPWNDGALWVGRGTNVLLRAGATWRRGPVRLTLAPEVTFSANGPVDLPVLGDPARSNWANPWRTPTAPADLPLRFGAVPLRVLHLGQSEVAVEGARLSMGIATGNLWWGPGLRNALVLSAAAPGIPRAFLRTRESIRTPLGDVDGRWFVGGLTESPFFDTLPSNDLRAVAGAALTLAPNGVDGLTVGLARLVVSPVQGAGALGSRILDPVLTWNGGDERDQMSSVFGRWLVPGSGVELWGEYAWQRLPDGIREWLTSPNADAGWTAGVQWSVARPVGAWRTQVEFSDVAQSVVDPARPPRDWGTGVNAVQGFTQRGRPLGGALGPGGTHGWVAIDRLSERWQVGGFVFRTRWENDAFYRSRLANPFGHDVSLVAGARGSWRFPMVELSGSIATERRYNVMFESRFLQPLLRGQRDESNLQLTFALTPR